MPPKKKATTSDVETDELTPDPDDELTPDPDDDGQDGEDGTEEHEGDPGVESQEPAAPEPYKSPEPFTMRLREPMTFYKEGSRHALQPGAPMSSQDYDVKTLIAQGAKLDMIDADGNVLLDLTEAGI